MFINGVVIVLQEILEAALMLSLLLSFLHYINRAYAGQTYMRRTWVTYSIVIGVLFAWIYSVNFSRVSEAFDYVGLEITNATIHSLSSLFLICIAWLVPSREHAGFQLNSGHRAQLLTVCMIAVVVLAILREGSEIFQFGGGVLGRDEATSILSGGLIGAGIGVCTGVLLYYALTGLPARLSLRACTLLLALTAGNMASQAVLLLTQADWISYSSTAWSSESLLSEASVVGQLAYALIGYESSPSWLQVGAYFIGGLFVLVSPISRTAWVNKAHWD